MTRITPIIIALSMSFIVSSSATGDLNITYNINTGEQRDRISSYIYGANWGDWGLSEDENLAAKRLGGNRLTGYNWENNFSNAGKDEPNPHNSDRYLVEDLPEAQQCIPGIAQTSFHNSCLDQNQLSVITLQMAGYVAADDKGYVSEGETGPSGSDRWKEVVYAKSEAFCDPSVELYTSDDYVYMDEFVNFLVQRYGDASTPGGVKCYSLDNEPALWPGTHERIHPEKVGCAELVDKSISLASAVKDIDPGAKILGPVLWGFSAYVHLENISDWNNVGNGYNWFIDYYLDQMCKAEQNYGRRLLDVLDLHWYSQAEGDEKEVFKSEPPYSRANMQARMQAPRTLWDPNYEENSWIYRSFRPELLTHCLPLLPKLIDSIEKYYPETKLSFSEYSYGGPDDISGGIAISDVLGIFGKYGVYLSTYWHYWNTSGNRDYVSAAFKIYRNYDGENSTFGDMKVHAETSDKENSSIYASVFDQDDSELHLIVINKNFDFSIDGTFKITSRHNFTSGRVWAFSADSANITEISHIPEITDNSFSYTVPQLTVCHMVLKAEPAQDPYANYIMDSWITAMLQDPLEWCLGAPDGWSIALGDGGWIVLDMGSGEAIVDGDGADMVVYEDPFGFWNEGYTVYGSNTSDGSWVLIGIGIGSQAFDLADESGLMISRYIKIEDDNDWPWTWPWEGFDIDAIEALNIESFDSNSNK